MSVFGESLQIEDERVQELQLAVVFGTGLVRDLEGSHICGLSLDLALFAAEDRC